MLCWPENKIDIDGLCRAYNHDDGPEQGAEAIAFLLIRERTDYTAIKRAVTLTGIDYWLDHKSSAQMQIFSKGSARLEVSGILSNHLRIDLNIEAVERSNRQNSRITLHFRCTLLLWNSANQ